MAKTILIGGGKILSEKFDWIDNYLKRKEIQNVLIIPAFSKNDKKWQDIVIKKFSQVGNFKYKIFTFNKKINLNKYDIIVVTGGYPDLLLKKLLPFKESLKKWFKNNKNLYVGISSGALILSEKVLITKDKDYKKSKIVKGLGIFSHSIETHYDPNIDTELKKINLKHLYCIEENSALIIEEKKIINYYGNIYSINNNDFLNKKKVKLKIALINGLLDSSKVGGAPISVINLGKKFASTGDEVYMISGDIFEAENINHIKSSNLIHISFSMLTSFNIKQIFNNWREFFYLVRYIFLTSKIIKKNKFDIIDNHGFWSFNQNIITVRYCIKGYYEKNKNILVPNKFKRVLLKLFDLRFLTLYLIESYYFNKRKYKKIIVVSEKVKNELIKFYNLPKNNIVVVNNAFEKKKYSLENYKMNRDIIRKRYNIKKDEILITFVGKNFKRKNLDFMLKLLESLNSNKIKILLAGSDEFQKYISKYSAKFKSKIIIEEWVKNIENIFFASDISLLPTYYDTCAKVVLEAMAAKNCILTTYESGCSEFIKHGINGFCFNDFNLETWRNTIIELIKNKNKMQKIQNAASNSICKRDWSVVAKESKEIYFKSISKYFV